MLHMNQPQLPIPDAKQWMTRKGAAAVLRVHWRTVDRLTHERLLTAHYPIGGPGERRPMLLWTPEVQELAAARKRAGRG